MQDKNRTGACYLFRLRWIFLMPRHGIHRWRISCHNSKESFRNAPLSLCCLYICSLSRFFSAHRESGAVTKTGAGHWIINKDWSECENSNSIQSLLDFVYYLHRLKVNMLNYILIKFWVFLPIAKNYRVTESGQILKTRLTYFWVLIIDGILSCELIAK